MQQQADNWSRRKDWQNGQIKPRHTRAPFIITLIFFVFWTGISLLVYDENHYRIDRALRQFVDSGYQTFDAMLLLPLMFLLSIIIVPSLIKTWRRFRVSSQLRLHLNPYPGELGGKVGGDILLPVKYRHGMKTDVRINCIKSRVSRSSNKSSRWEKVVWRTKADVQLMPFSNQTQIHFNADTIKDLPESSIEERGSYAYWAVRIQLPDDKFDETFNIPVFASSYSRDIEYYETPLQSKSTGYTSVPSEVAVIKQGSDGDSVFYPAGREKTIARVFIVMAIIFDLVAVFMGYQVFSELSGERTRYFAVMVSGMIFLGFLVFGVGMLIAGIYMITNTLRVDIGNSGITTTRRVFGRTFVTQIENDDIREIVKKVSAQSGQGASANINYSLQLLSTDGRRVAIGDGIPGHENADRLYDYFKTHLRLNPSRDSALAMHKLPIPEWAGYLVVGVKVFAGLAFLATIAAFILDFMAM